MNLRLSLFGYEVLDLSFGRSEEIGYVLVNGEYDIDPEAVSYGFALDNNKE